MGDANPPVLRTLEWDSEHFGIPVGELDVEGVEADAVRNVLEERGGAFDLIYVRNADATRVPQELLETFHGERADVRATFELSPIEFRGSVDMSASGSVRPLTKQDTATHGESLASLALQVAEHSRFRNDSRFPHEWVTDLYESWLARSLEGEEADEILIFASESGPLGFYTIKVQETVGNLVLFAVDAHHRGQGIGRALAVAGLEWMRQNGLVRATVTTQLENPACKLYRGLGYTLMKTEEVYHLWPNANRDGNEGLSA